MKFCEKCGKELFDEAVICPNCGCAVENKVKIKEASYDDCIKSAATTNIISIVVIALGVIVWLFVNMWAGAILCFVAEFIALIPNSKVQKAFKQNGLVGNSNEIKEKRKSIMKDLRAKPAFIFSFVLAIIALLLLVVFVMPI